ncbi:MAG: hypothetical protein PF505_01245 [Vallitaleaceae bacterium]|jgi:hypothetical protein|nr:hypothetical protein [Vallitaleaceae bacterium]
MKMKIGLTLACMNMKKLAMMLQKTGKLDGIPSNLLCYIQVFLDFEQKKRAISAFA